MKTKLFERSNLIRFDDQSFSSTLLGLIWYWEYAPNNEEINQILQIQVQ